MIQVTSASGGHIQTKMQRCIKFRSRNNAGTSKLHRTITNTLAYKSETSENGVNL